MSDNDMFALSLFGVALCLTVAFASSSISRGNEVRAMCREFAARDIYYSACENWNATKSLHQQLLEKQK